MLRFISIFAALFLASSAAQAFNLKSPGTYQGRGEWKSLDNMRGYYDSTAVIAIVSGDEEALKISYTNALKIYFNDEIVSEESFTLTFAAKGNDIYDVFAGEELVGSGYCFGPICHYNITTAEEVSEETLHFEEGQLSTIGSWKDAESAGAYSGNLQKIEQK